MLKEGSGTKSIHSALKRTTCLALETASRGRDAAPHGSPLGHVAAAVYRRGRSAVTFRQRFTLTRIAAKIFRALMHEGQELFVWRTYAEGPTFQGSPAAAASLSLTSYGLLFFLSSARMRT